MNIDIVNKEISNKLNISEKDVALVNKVYWRKIYDHVYSYDTRAINIQHVCVLYQDKYEIKRILYKYIKKLRRLKTSKRREQYSQRFQDNIDFYSKIFRNYWKIRKDLKFTN